MKMFRSILNTYISLFKKISARFEPLRRLLAKIDLQYFLYFSMFIPALLIFKSIDNDFYFIVKHGEYVVHHGFPTIEPFSMHSGLDFVMQQWLSSVIFYFTHKCTGMLGVILLTTIVCMLNTYLLYKILVRITDNPGWSCILAGLNTILIHDCITTRPIIFTYTLTLLLIYILLLYTQTGNVRLLYLLPIISILQVNLHASMWLFLFFMIMPFIFELKIFTYKNITYEKYNKKPLLLFTLLMIPAGLLNPYGYKSMLYVLNSLSSNSEFVFEMRKSAFDNPGGSIFILLLIIFTLLFINASDKINIRYIFFFWGCYLLFMFALRNIPYIVLAAIMLTGHITARFDIKRFIKKIGLIKVYTIVLIMFILGCCTFTYVGTSAGYDSEYKVIDYIADNCVITPDTKVYTSYNNGAYAIYRNLKCYLDPRMEVYLKSQNHKKDIFDEFILLQAQKLDYSEFLEQYQFDYIVASKSDVLYKKLSEDASYTCIYEKKKCRVYVPAQQ